MEQLKRGYCTECGQFAVLMSYNCTCGKCDGTPLVGPIRTQPTKQEMRDEYKELMEKIRTRQVWEK